MNDVQARLAEWLEHVTDAESHAELESLQNAGDASAIKDAFYQDLEFGTAGLRGIIGAGTNRMNIYTVGRATQGFANYLNEHFENPTVAIARDSRNKGEEFVRLAAGVLAANGITAWVYPRIEPTPALSFAVRDLGCSGGICMTASHNPAPYNGYKAYGSDGCQITSEAAAAISAAIQEVDTFADVLTMDFDEALAEGKVRWIPEETLDRFIDAVAAQSLVEAKDTQTSVEEAPLKVVYTPLNGTGLECVSRILTKVGITDVVVVPEQAEPDGNFPTCPYPNPEIREALQKGIELCEEVHPDLLLATDPDADRVGVAVHDGEDYTLLSGNEMGVLLLDYVAKMRVARGEDLTRAIAVTTIVSSSMVDALAKEYGFVVRRVLTGFKYIGEVIGQLEAAGEADRFIFGFEESYGYLSGTHVRDKDAVNASMLICQMAQYYKQQGMNLADAMRALYEKHGYFKNATISVEYPGASGADRMRVIMKKAREEAPVEIAGLDVTGTVDYAPGIGELPPANVMSYLLEKGNKIMLRPSGTEPKIKAYMFAQDKDEARAQQLLERLTAAAREILA